MTEFNLGMFNFRLSLHAPIRRRNEILWVYGDTRAVGRNNKWNPALQKDQMWINWRKRQRMIENLCFASAGDEISGNFAWDCFNPILNQNVWFLTAYFTPNYRRRKLLVMFWRKRFERIAVSFSLFTKHFIFQLHEMWNHLRASCSWFAIKVFFSLSNLWKAATFKYF